jgi:hypothetical protein
MIAGAPGASGSLVIFSSSGGIDCRSLYEQRLDFSRKDFNRDHNVLDSTSIVR